LQDALVVAEVSISYLQLIGAGLAIRSLQHLAAINSGYDTSHVVNLAANPEGIVIIRVSLPQLQTSGSVEGQLDAKVVVAAGDILGRITGRRLVRRERTALPNLSNGTASSR
jgi:hypothetical protein